jgi:hypothetical protein
MPDFQHLLPTSDDDIRSLRYRRHRILRHSIGLLLSKTLERRDPQAVGDSQARFTAMAVEPWVFRGTLENRSIDNVRAIEVLLIKPSSHIQVGTLDHLKPGIPESQSTELRDLGQMPSLGANCFQFTLLIRSFADWFDRR